MPVLTVSTPSYYVCCVQRAFYTECPGHYPLEKPPYYLLLHKRDGRVLFYILHTLQIVAMMEYC